MEMGRDGKVGVEVGHQVGGLGNLVDDNEWGAARSRG